MSIRAQGDVWLRDNPPSFDFLLRTRLRRDTGRSVFDSHANAHRDAGEIIVEIEAPDAAVAA